MKRLDILMLSHHCGDEHDGELERIVGEIAMTQQIEVHIQNVNLNTSHPLDVVIMAIKTSLVICFFVEKGIVPALERLLDSQKSKVLWVGFATDFPDRFAPQPPCKKVAIENRNSMTELVLGIAETLSSSSF